MNATLRHISADQLCMLKYNVILSIRSSGSQMISAHFDWTFLVMNIMNLFEFVLKNSYFSCEQDHYPQTLGCAMGSPVSATRRSLTW